MRNFDGTDDELSLNSDVAVYKITTGDLSLFVAIESDLGATDQMVFGKWSSLTVGRSYRIGINGSDKYVFQVVDILTTLRTAVSTTARTAGLVTVGGGWSVGSNIHRLWLNGVLEHNGNVAGSTGIQDTLSHLQFGTSDNGANDFAGRAGNGAIWSELLTTEEFAALHAGVPPQKVHPSGLIGHWRLTGESPEPDLSPQGNNMVVVAGTTVTTYEPPFGPWDDSYAHGALYAATAVEPPAAPASAARRRPHRAAILHRV